MNPSSLYFSKGNALLQLFLMTAVVAVAIWALSQSSLFASPEPPPVLTDYTAQGGPMIYTPPPYQSPTDELTGGRLTVAVMSICLILGVWEIGMKSWRLLSSQAALAVQNGMLAAHPSFLKADNEIRLDAVRAVIFDRSDRVQPDDLNAAMAAFSLSHRLAMKFGGRLRHSLLIEYVSELGAVSILRIGDAEVEGGVAQMARFADYLRSMTRANLRNRDTGR